MAKKKNIVRFRSEKYFVISAGLVEDNPSFTPSFGSSSHTSKNPIDIDVRKFMQNNPEVIVIFRMLMNETSVTRGNFEIDRSSTMGAYQLETKYKETASILMVARGLPFQ